MEEEYRGKNGYWKWKRKIINKILNMTYWCHIFCIIISIGNFKEEEFLC